MVSVMDRLVAVAPDVKAIMASASKTADGKKAAGDKVLAILLMHDLAYKDTLKMQHVAIHPQNRFGAGVSPSDVITHIQNIIRDGWSWPEVHDRARAFEKQLGEKGRQQIQKNKDWVAESEGMLAPIVEEDIRVFTIATTHTTQGLRAILNSTLGCSDPKLTSSDGRFSKEKIIEISTAIQGPLESGIEFLVIRREVETAIPDLPTFLQETGNIGHSTRNTLTKMQAMLQIHRMGVANADANAGNCEWEKIAQSIEQSQPHLEGHGKSLCDFVEKWSGGVPPIHLQELETFSKSLTFTRDIPSSTWDLLSKLPLAQYPEYVVSMAKALLATPDAFCKQGETRLFCTADAITLATSNKANVAEVCRVLRKAKGTLDQLELAHPTKTKLYGDLGVRLVMFVHKKTVKSRKAYMSIDEIASQFTTDLLVVAPMQIMAMGLPFPALAAQQSPSAGGSSLVQFGAGGVSPATIVAKGFAVEGKVKHKESKEVFAIVSIGESVTLRGPAQDDTKDVSPAALLDEYSPVEDIAESSYVDFKPLLHNDLNLELKKADVLKAIVKAYEDHESSDGLKVVSRGSRRHVFTTKHFDAGKLVLVPLCTSISTTYGTVGEKNVSLGALYKHTISNRSVQFFVSNNFESGAPLKEKAKEQFIVPFWAVDQSADTATCNLEQVTLKVKLPDDRIIEVPCLKNKKAIPEQTELFVHDKIRQSFGLKRKAVVAKAVGSKSAAKGA